MLKILSDSNLHKTMIEWRRQFHTHPETAFEEVNTSKRVAELLTEFGLDVYTGLAKTGVVGVLQGSLGGERMIGLRADIDALNITEQTGVEYKSTIDGKMHACGHDGHTTMLLGAAKYLSEHPDFAGKVAFIFQPAEEEGGGGQVMCKDGLFEQFPCDAVYGMHNWPGIPIGHFVVHKTAVMASAESFKITIQGQGGHAAMPHLGHDPMMVVTQLISAFQTIVSRNVSPFESSVISVTQVDAGSAFNIIPDSVDLSGTVRTFSSETRELIHAEMHKKLKCICDAFTTKGELTFNNYYPATINVPEHADYCADTVRNLVDETQLDLTQPPSMGGEDFSFMLNAKPGAYIWMGNGDSSGLHHPKYNFNDDGLPYGASYWVQLVYDRLK